jgi:hypothetical protein
MPGSITVCSRGLGIGLEVFEANEAEVSRVFL